MAKEKENSLCFVCCKSASQSTSSREGSKNILSYEIYFEFFSFAERYLQFNASDWCYDSKLEVFCESCLEKLKRICELYEELCEAELQLSSKLRELGKLLGKPQKNVLVKEEKTEITTSLEEAGAVEGIRNFLASKCLKKVENIKIKRTEDGSDKESSEEPLLESGNDEDDDDDDVKLEVEEYHKEDLFDSEEEEVEMEVGIPTSPLNNQRTESIKSEDNSCFETEESIFEPGSEDGSTSEAESSDEEDEESIEEDEKESLQKSLCTQNEPKKSMINTKIISDNNFASCDQCGKVCFNSQGLYTHLLWHEKQTTPVKPKTPCCFCSNSFVSKQIQLLHMELRHPLEFSTVKPFKCDEKDCESSFRSVPELNKHIAKHSKQIEFCSVCQWGFVNSDYLKLHELLHTPANKKRYPCPICKVKAKNLMDLQVHYDRLHGARLGLEIYKCPECEKVFSTRLRFEKHMRKLGNSDEDEDDEKRHKCCYCGARFSDKEGRRKHLLEECIKTPEIDNNMDNIIQTTDRNGKLVKGVECKICGKLVRKASMKLHLTTHLEKREEARVICYICGDSFTSEITLNSHMDFIHKGIKRKRVECQDCGKSFSKNSFLNDHVDKVHKGIDISVICEICGVVLSCQTTYKTHRKTMHLRLEEKPHACHLCQERYKRRPGLKQHLARVHGKTKGEEFTSGESLFLKLICMFPSCDVKFGTSEELQAHVEQKHTPTGVKEFMCKLCGKVVANQARLTRHNLVHTQKKPHACQLCSKSFANKASLKNHLKAVHDEGTEQFACDQPNCQSKFKLRKYLWRHLRDVHNTENEQFACEQSNCQSKFKIRKYLARHLRDVHGLRLSK